MKRRLVLQIALSISLVATAGAPVVAAIVPLPVYQAASTQTAAGGSDQSMVELSLERQLEESLQQSLSAYLGQDNFVLQVRVVIAKDASAHQAISLQTPARYAPQPGEDPFAADFNAVLAQPDERPRHASRLSPSAVFPRLPAPGRYSRLPAPAPAPQLPVQVAQPVATPHIEQIRISLVLPSALQKVDEDYIKNLVFQRADLNLGRGDTFDLTRRDFPRMAGLGATQSKGGGIPAWLWAIFGALGASTLIGGVIGRRQVEPVSSLIGGFLARRPFFEAQPVLAPALVPTPMPSAVSAVPTELQRAAEGVPASVATSTAPEQPTIRQDLLVMLLESPEIGERYLRRLLGEDGGLMKAATFWRAMGLNVAKRLFTGLDVNEWKTIELTALDQKDVSHEDQQAVLEEAHFAMLRDQSEQPGQDKDAPFAFLHTLDDPKILYLLDDEGPRVQALVLSQLPPDRAVGLMRQKTPVEQGAIAAAMGDLHLLPMSSFHDLAQQMAEKVSKVPTFVPPVSDGLGLLVNLLDHSDRATERGILSGLSTQNPKLLAQVREVYLSFDDLAKVPHDVLKDALREVDKEYLAEALREAPDQIRDAIVPSLTDRARRIVEDALSQPPVGRPDTEKIEAIRKDLVARVRQLMQAGRFSLKEFQIT